MKGEQKSVQQLKSESQSFFRIGVSVDCVIFGFEDDALKVLLIQSDMEEYQEMWSLLGDLVRPDENLDDASYRVLRDRTGLDNVYLEQVHTFGEVNRHPAGRVVTTAYFSLVNIKDHQLKLSDHNLHWPSIINAFWIPACTSCRKRLMNILLYSICCPRSFL
jgi:8-oxo-dGTP diphosphatase